MAPCDVIGVDKERWTKWADSEGVVLLFDVDFSDNATLFVYRIAVKSYGYKKMASLAWFYVHGRCSSGPVFMLPHVANEATGNENKPDTRVSVASMCGSVLLRLIKISTFKYIFIIIIYL